MNKNLGLFVISIYGFPHNLRKFTLNELFANKLKQITKRSVIILVPSHRKAYIITSY